MLMMSYCKYIFRAMKDPISVQYWSTGLHPQSAMSQIMKKKDSSLIGDSGNLTPLFGQQWPPISRPVQNKQECARMGGQGREGKRREEKREEKEGRKRRSSSKYSPGT